jgi:hypothetical protein
MTQMPKFYVALNGQIPMAQPPFYVTMALVVVEG